MTAIPFKQLKSSYLGKADENPLHFNGEMIVRPLE
jgi:hypothetical protein